LPHFPDLNPNSLLFFTQFSSRYGCSTL
jgi:hypothetical protein